MTKLDPTGARTTLPAETGICELNWAAAALRPEISLGHPRFRAAAKPMEAKRFGAAGKVLHEFLGKRPRDTRGLYLAGEAASALDRHAEAEALLTKCREIDADFTAARYALVTELIEINMPQATKDHDAKQLVRRLRACWIDRD